MPLRLQRARAWLAELLAALAELLGALAELPCGLILWLLFRVLVALWLLALLIRWGLACL